MSNNIPSFPSSESPYNPLTEAVSSYLSAKKSLNNYLRVTRIATGDDSEDIKLRTVLFNASEDIITSLANASQRGQEVTENLPELLKLQRTYWGMYDLIEILLSKPNSIIVRKEVNGVIKEMSTSTLVAKIKDACTDINQLKTLSNHKDVDKYLATKGITRLYGIREYIRDVLWHEMLSANNFNNLPRFENT